VVVAVVAVVVVAEAVAAATAHFPTSLEEVL
jgi:hypothetical protein